MGERGKCLPQKKSREREGKWILVMGLIGVRTMCA